MSEGGRTYPKHIIAPPLLEVGHVFEVHTPHPGEKLEGEVDGREHREGVHGLVHLALPFTFALVRDFLATTHQRAQVLSVRVKG